MHHQLHDIADDDILMQCGAYTAQYTVHTIFAKKTQELEQGSYRQ